MIVITEQSTEQLLSFPFFPTSKFDHAALADAAGIRELTNGTSAALAFCVKEKQHGPSVRKPQQPW